MINALEAFDAELLIDDDGQYLVEVILSSDRQIVDVLSSLERYVDERQSGPARFVVGGHKYTMHPRPSPSEIAQN